MEHKLHPATQKAVNRYAQGYLSLYRASRSAGTDKNTARWQARMSMNLRTKNGNIYAIANARSFRYDKARKNYQERTKDKMKNYPYHQEDRTPEIDDAANEAGAAAEEAKLQRAEIRTLDQEIKANILREAAPQLLDALTDLIGAFDKARTMRAPAGHYDEDIYYNGIDLYAQIENAREAIAKAQGRPEQPERPEFPVYYDAQGREHAEF